MLDPASDIYPGPLRRILVVDDELEKFDLETNTEDNGFKVDTYPNPMLSLENFKANLYVYVL